VISSAELAGLRAVATATLPDTATVRRPGAQVSDGAGGYTTSYADVPGLIGVPCSVSPLGAGDEQTFGSQIIAVANWVVRIPAASAVRTTDQIVVTVADQASTRTFEVLAVAGPRSFEISRRVACREARS
jgi:hypothetical protein